MPDRVPPILVGFDGSPDARRAVDWAAGVTRATGATLHLVRALSLPRIPTHPGETTVAALLDEHERAARAELDVERRRLEASGIAVESHLRRWLAAETLLEHAAEHDGGLLVVGQHGHGATRLLLGGVSNVVARAARIPVVVVRGRECAAPPRRVLLAFDGSPSSQRAAEAVGRWCVGAHVSAVHVRDAGVSVDEGELRDALVRAGLELGRCDARITDGPVVETLLAHAAHRDVDLVAAGRRGLSPWRELLLGGVSEKLVQLSPCPVLLAH